MKTTTPLGFDLHHVRRATWLFVALWTLAVGASILWNERLLHDAMFDAATQDAREVFKKDLFYLTSPALMTRQPHELKAQDDDLPSHITSLKPLNPENAPDAWETAALRAFEQGKNEVKSRELHHGKPHLRLMKPLITETACLECHNAQGYKAGDICGGIAIAVELKPYLSMVQTRAGHIAGAHVGLWALGIAGVILGARQLRQRIGHQLRAEEVLRESELRYRSLFDNMLEGYAHCQMLYDAKGRPVDFVYLSVNQAFEQITKLKNVVGKPVSEVIPGIREASPELFERYGCIAATGVPDKFEFNSTLTHQWLSISVYSSQKGFFVAVFEDITQRKQAEAALRDSEALYHSLVGQLPQCVFRKDLEGRFTFVNANYCRHMGKTSEEILGRTDFDFAPRELAEKYRLDDQRVVADCRPCEQVEENVQPNGERIFVQVVKTPLVNAQREVVGLQGIFWDITERKRAEEKIRQLSRAVEQNPASIVITDRAGRIEYVNPKFINITGYTLEEVLGQNPRVLKSGDKGPEEYRELWQTITEGHEWHGEFHNKKKNGDLYWESASISPIRDNEGQITHYVAVKEDITARKQTEAERDHLIQDLQSALANVKTLTGLVPICAWCKQIRDDKGYWNQVETYIGRHSEVKFSHGMCPDCLKKHYPELLDDSGNSTQ